MTASWVGCQQELRGLTGNGSKKRGAGQSNEFYTDDNRSSHSSSSASALLHEETYGRRAVTVGRIGVTSITVPATKIALPLQPSPLLSTAVAT